MNAHSKPIGVGIRNLVVMLSVLVLVPGDTLADLPSPRRAQASTPKDQTAKIPPGQLDSLVAPVALYPDPLLAQVLAASTYPLELILLQQWLSKNSGLKDKALVDAVAKQPWDPSIQAMAALPDVAKRLADDIQWTTDLGNAFLAQQSDVMDAVQGMRRKAQDTGNLKSTEQQKVETKVVENKSVIVVEQANPQVVYVPSYDPIVVYGPPAYPYPPIYYPPAGYYAAGMAISFGIGVAMGAAWGGGWGWGCGWGGSNVYVNHNNNFNRNTNINGGNRNNIGNGNRGNVGGGNRGDLGAGNIGAGDASWKHNPQHRGGAPYGDRGTAERFGGTARGDTISNRQSGARNQPGRQGGSTRPGGGVSAGSLPSGGGADRIGGRDLSGGGGGNRDAFGGGNGGFDGSKARANGNRGAGSMGSRGASPSRGGGGVSRGGRGGGRRR